MKLQKKLLVASRNKGKIAEFQRLFGSLGIEIKSLNDYMDIPDVIEDGTTFEDNARKKAKEIAEQLMVPTLADDSGLCVDLLQGEPGVYSARYAGEHGLDQNNNDKLLRELSKVRASDRLSGEQSLNQSQSQVLPDHHQGKDSPLQLSPARFVCVLALYDPFHATELMVRGECEGAIIDAPRGKGGFGYDPLFYLPEMGLTMAELSVEHKNELSHRGKALRALLDKITNGAKLSLYKA